MGNSYCACIMTNRNHTVLYTGVTNNLTRRVCEHKSRLVEDFTKKYHATKLVYFEAYDSPRSAVAREKQIKAGSRQKKLDLINAMNPEWKDLYDKLT